MQDRVWNTTDKKLKYGKFKCEYLKIYLCVDDQLALSGSFRRLRVLIDTYTNTTEKDTVNLFGTDEVDSNHNSSMQIMNYWIRHANNAHQKEQLQKIWRK